MLLLYLISRHDYSNNHDVLSRFKCWVLGQGGHACAKSTVYQTTPTPVLAFLPATVTFGNENKSTPCWCPTALHGGFYLKAVFYSK
jgi:hypothetical protein